MATTGKHFETKQGAISHAKLSADENQREYFVVEIFAGNRTVWAVYSHLPSMANYIWRVDPRGRVEPLTMIEGEAYR